MKCVRHILSGLAVASMSIAAHAASFDCIKAQSEVERMICGSADLSGLDDQLGKAWTQHLRNNAFKDQFRRTQRRWIEQRNQCKDAACLRQAYLARLEQMTSGKEYFLREGEDQPLCERVVRALNARGRREDAMNHLLEIVRRDRNWNEDGARKQLVQFFEAWGPTDEATVAGRRRLSSILFA